MTSILFLLCKLCIIFNLYCLVNFNSLATILAVVTDNAIYSQVTLPRCHEFISQRYAKVVPFYTARIATCLLPGLCIIISIDFGQAIDFISRDKGQKHT